MSSIQSDQTSTLSLKAVDVQMKIIQGLVTGMPIKDILDLVLQGLCMRFTGCGAGIWITGWVEGKRMFYLAANINLPPGLNFSAELDTNTDNDEEKSELLDDIQNQLRQQFDEQGIHTVDLFPIRNTKGVVVGLTAIFLPQFLKLPDIELQLIQRYSLVAGLAIEKEQLDQENHLLAYYDYLTMIPNRRLFHQRLANAIEDSAQSGHPFSLVLVDLDKFKDINDTFGHAAGDRVLKVVARRITQTLGEDDTVARLGGDEFGLILARTTGTQALGVMDRIIDDIRQPISWKEGYVSVFASAGIVSCPAHGTNEDELLRHADASLYETKNVTDIHAKLHSPSITGN